MRSHKNAQENHRNIRKMRVICLLCLNKQKKKETKKEKIQCKLLVTELEKKKLEGRLKSCLREMEEK